MKLAAGAQTLTRDGRNRVTSVNISGTLSAGNGNLTYDGTRPFAYDSANRLTAMVSSTLSYDPLDRLTEMVGTLGAHYLYHGDESSGVAHRNHAERPLRAGALAGRADPGVSGCAGNASRQMYTGQLWMPDFGLYHYKAQA